MLHISCHLKFPDNTDPWLFYHFTSISARMKCSQFRRRQKLVNTDNSTIHLIRTYLMIIGTGAEFYAVSNSYHDNASLRNQCSLFFHRNSIVVWKICQTNRSHTSQIIEFHGIEVFLFIGRKFVERKCESLDIAVIWWWCIWIVIIIVYCLWISGRKYETNSSDNMNKMSFIFPLRSIGLEFWNIYNIHCTTIYKKPCLRNWEI